MDVDKNSEETAKITLILGLTLVGEGGISGQDLDEMSQGGSDPPTPLS